MGLRCLGSIEVWVRFQETVDILVSDDLPHEIMVIDVDLVNIFYLFTCDVVIHAIIAKGVERIQWEMWY